jgi:hypothetical protein
LVLIIKFATFSKKMRVFFEKFPFGPSQAFFWIQGAAAAAAAAAAATRTDRIRSFKNVASIMLHCLSSPS